VVPVVGRSALALADERLNGVRLVDLAVSVSSAAAARVLVVSGETHDFFGQIAPFERVLIHDLLCPLTPPEFLREMAVSEPAAAAAVTPVTDTLKAMDGDLVAHTVDRDSLYVVASPVVVDRDVLARVPDVVEALSDAAVLVQRLRSLADVALTPAPFLARRIVDAAELRVLSLRPAT
jgi:2-C-methyl-D-erythritol 4-phosphate cytidylyltransferase